MRELDDEKLIAKLVDDVDLSYPKALKDKSLNLQTALAIGVVKVLLQMAEKEEMPLVEVESIRLMQLMLRLIEADMNVSKNYILEKFLQDSTLYMPKEKSL
tara:strand:+ start:103 stop:405 length:303 start_codon:yes stop_codon:yes gene_type:complete